MEIPLLVLQLDDYRNLIALDKPFVPVAPVRPENKAALLNSLITQLRAKEQAVGVDSDLLRQNEHAARRELRRLLTVRSPFSLTDAFQAAMDSLLQEELSHQSQVEASSLPRMCDFDSTGRYPAAANCALWLGDITTLRADAIVNAANAEFLGCFRPFHACIDNSIHSTAGPRLRDDCAQIMRAQGHSEPVGCAKATRGYNLPARYVLHTVGPVVEGRLCNEHEELLAACYRECLDLAARLSGARTVAFCAISTGVFGFPKVPAARVALRTVAQWLDQHLNALDLVVFNVFSDSDRAAYEEAIVWKGGVG